jgi:carbonic anhydrase
MHTASLSRHSRTLLAIGTLLACAGLIAGPAVGAAPDHDDHAPAPAAPPGPAGPAATPATKAPASAPAPAPAAGERARPRTPAATPSRPAPAAPTPANTQDNSTNASPAAEPATQTAPRPAARPSASKPADADAGPIDADRALALLTEGNARWVAGESQNPSTDPARRTTTAEKGQKPFVTVLTCADSRLPVERLFDRGVGEVFVIRVAGNVSGPSETGTIEYGVGHLHTPLLVVMGHTRCGAVAAAASGAELHGALGGMVARINPAVERARRANPGIDQQELTRLVITENIWQSMFDLLRSSDELRSAVASGQVRLVGALCDISTGKVDWLGEHPWQSELLAALNAGQPVPVHAGTMQPSKATPQPTLPAAPAAPAHAGAKEEHGH